GLELSPGAGEAFDAFMDGGVGAVDIDPDERSGSLAGGVDAAGCDADAVAAGRVGQDGGGRHGEPRPGDGGAGGADAGGLRDGAGEVVEGGVDGCVQSAAPLVGDAVQVGEQLEGEEL